MSPFPAPVTLRRPVKPNTCLDEALSTIKNQRISLSRAMTECLLASLSSYREVVGQTKLLLGHTRSHESNGDKWITSGIRDYFPSATYLLCRFHLNKRLKEALPGNKTQQKLIRSLLLSDRIDEALAGIDNLLVVSSEPKQKKLLADFLLLYSEQPLGDQ